MPDLGIGEQSEPRPEEDPSLESRETTSGQVTIIECGGQDCSIGVALLTHCTVTL